MAFLTGRTVSVGPLRGAETGFAQTPRGLAEPLPGLFGRKPSNPAGSAGLPRRRGRPAAGDVVLRAARGRGGAIRFGLVALVGAGSLAGLFAAASSLVAAAPPGAATDASAPQAWVEVKRPIPMYDLAGTEFAKLPTTYAARRHLPDGTREDILSFGSLGEGRPYLRLVLSRPGSDGGPDAPPLADALAHAAVRAADTVTGVRSMADTATRFGRLERADFTLWSAGSRTACQGFRARPEGGAVLTLAGFACPPAGYPLNEAAVACAVDRIDLLSAGEDEALRALFVAAERRPGRADCREGVLAARLETLPTDGPFAAQRRRAAWLDAGAPPLRGALPATDGDR